MSIKYMNRVWDNQELKHGRLITMLALADHANDAGECWPSQTHLVEKTRLTDRQLRRVIDSLASDGYLAVIETGRGRGKKPRYRLFPQPVEKADILSEEKRTKCPNSEIKADILSRKSGHFEHVKADISDTKADISDKIQSHARSEPPIEPTTEPSIESSSLGDEDDDGRKADPFGAAWQETYSAPIPDDIAKAIARELDHCSDDAIIYAIRTSVNAKQRTFKYLRACAENYIPPAPQPPAPTYALNLPGVHRFEPPAPTSPPVAPAAAPPPRPAALAHDDPWVDGVAELCSEHARFADWLPGSTLTATDAVRDGLPVYRLCVADARGVQWLETMSDAIRRKIGTLLRRRVVIEIVAAEAESEVMA